MQNMLGYMSQIFDALPYPVFAKNNAHQWIYGNKAFEALIGTSDFIGKDDRAFFPPSQVKAFRTEDRRVFAGEESLTEEPIGPDLFALTRKVPLKLPDGSHGLVAIVLASIKPGQTKSDDRIVFEALDRQADENVSRLSTTWAMQAAEFETRLSEAESSRAEALLIAQTDPTTGLKNRLGFEIAMEEAIRSAAKSGKRFGVGFIDVDKFKQINDRFGHAVGDRVLKTVGRRLTELPDVFAVARWGGDEFAILTELPDLGDAALTQGFSEAREYVFRRTHIQDRQLDLSGSGGIAVYPDDAIDPEGLMRCADIALITAKRRGRNQIMTFNKEIDIALKRRMQIMRDLRGAIDGGAIRAYYQPIVCASSRAVMGVEVLGRWTHPELGPVSPDEFFDLARVTGMASDLDFAIRDLAFREARQWLESGAIAHLSVNISPNDIVSSEFAASFLQHLADTGVSPRHICLEIVESAIVANLDAATRNLRRLRAAGVTIALDDYGTGYSNMSAVLDLPLDKLKLDQSLIRALGTNNKVAVLLTSIMQLAKNLNVSIVAEGVETRLQSAFITSVGCDLMQGYLFSKALPFETMDAWLNDYREKVA